MTNAFARSLIAGVTAATIALTAVLPASAQSGRKIALVRDAEAESLIRDYARPILKAAGLGGADIQIKIVNDRMYNAFVADGRRIFLNAGTIIQSETPNELIGVIAHETGHLAGGHLARLREAVARAQILSALAIIGGAAAAAAGSSSDLPGVSGAGSAAALGGVQIGHRSILAYQRGEETNADRAALSYLEKTGQSAAGMLASFKRLAGQQIFSASSSDPYAMSHPLAADRLAALEETARASPHFARRDDPDLQRRHDLVRAKFIAFTGSAEQTRRAYPQGDDSLPAAYAAAIVAYRYGDPRGAVAKIDELIRREPGNPWFWELKGQALLETGSPRDAVEPLRKAVSLAPRAGLLRVMLGHALVATEDPALLREAVEALTKGLGEDPDQPIGYRQLAIAHARLGDIALADLATAQGSFAAGDITAAKQYATRAQGKLKRGTPAWLRADDIVTYKAPNY